MIALLWPGGWSRLGGVLVSAEVEEVRVLRRGRREGYRRMATLAVDEAGIVVMVVVAEV